MEVNRYPVVVTVAEPAGQGIRVRGLSISSQADQGDSLSEVEVGPGGCFDAGEVTEGGLASSGVDSRGKGSSVTESFLSMGGAGKGQDRRDQ